MYKQKEDFITKVLDEKYSYNCKMTNRFNTTITISKNGIENRLKNWNSYLKKYDISYSVKNDIEIDEIRDLFNEVGGSWKGFLFKDFTDCYTTVDRLYIKNLYKNYVRIYDKKTNRKIDSFKTNDFLKEGTYQEFDNLTGKVYLNVKKQILVEYNYDVNSYDFLIFPNLRYYVGYIQSSNRIYIQDFYGKEKELLVTKLDIENNKIYFLNKEEENLKIEKVNIYESDVAYLSGIINNNYEDNIEYYHVVRFADDDFTIQINDYNINTSNIQLVELKQKD